MNWNEEWDYESNGDGWKDGRSNGLRGPSAVPLPRSIVRIFLRFILTMLAVAGVAGAIFQLYLCVRIAARVMNQ